MIVVSRPEYRAAPHVQDEVLELRCCRCGKRFRSLDQCYLSYEIPALGARSEATWVHKICGEKTSIEGRRLVRADFGLKTLLERLIKPVIPTAALTDDRSRGRMNWSST